MEQAKIKKCASCRESKTVDNFCKGNGVLGKHQYCKPCQKIHKDLWSRQNPEKYIFASAKGNAKKKGQEFSITSDDIKIPTHCPVLGIPIQILSKNRDYAASIDRIDNNKGYHPDNIVVISGRANRLKNDSTIDEMETIIKWRKSFEIKD